MSAFKSRYFFIIVKNSIVLPNFTKLYKKSLISLGVVWVISKNS